MGRPPLRRRRPFGMRLSSVVAARWSEAAFPKETGRIPVYHDVAQWTMVRQKVLDKGRSRRQVARETGLSRKTIRKMLLHKLPQPYKPRTPRHPSLQQYTAMLDAFASLSVTTPRHRVSISEIYRCLKREEGYTGSYGAVRDYLRFRLTARQASTKNIWEQLYEEIVSISKNDAITLLQSLSFNNSSLISQHASKGSSVTSRACVSTRRCALGKHGRNRTWTG
jgi:hypothetical protein